jgi:chromosome segregation ATPase
MGAIRGRRFEPESFEFLKASDTAALLRIAGRWRGGAPDHCVLVADDGGQTLRIEPLPAPPAGPGDELWRAAYPATVALAQSDAARFTLETVQGPVGLPRPSERGAERPAERPRRPEPTAPRLPGLIERARDARVRSATQRRRRAERALSHERAARREAERTAERERARFETALAEARDSVARAAVERGRFLHFIEEGAAQRARLERDVAELRRQAEEARGSAESAVRAERELDAAVARLRGEAESARALAEERGRALGEVDQRIAAIRGQLEREIEDLRRAADEARSSAESAVRTRDEAEGARALAEERGRALRKVDRRIAAMRHDLERERRRQADLQDELRAASSREAALRQDLDEARTDADTLRTRVTELEATTARLRTGFEHGHQRLAAADALAQELKARVAAVAAQREERAGAGTVAALREQLEQRAGRLAELEHQATALRDAIRARMAAGSVHEGQRELVAAP